MKKEKWEEELYDTIQSIIFGGGAYSQPDPMLIKGLTYFISKTIKEERAKSELIGAGKMLDNLWDGSVPKYGMRASDGIKVEMEYYFGKNWSKDMYDFITEKGEPRPQMIKTLKELKKTYKL